ncbi:hypothetical protein BR141012304_12078 [Brucella inopinata]|nr:hypothetical protein BR141012304_12078 [Brucella inopinata]
MGDDAVMAGEAFLDEMLCCGNEVLERIGLLVALSVFVPGEPLSLPPRICAIA